MVRATSHDFNRKLYTSILVQYVSSASLGDVKSLVKVRSDLNTVDDDGASLIHHAVLNSNTDVLEYLLEKSLSVGAGDNCNGQGISLETKCNYGATPLLYCAGGGTLENLMVLVKRGANVNARDKEGKTAIHYSVNNADTAAIVKLLLENGMSIESRDNLGRTPLHYCSIVGSLKNMKALIDEGASVETRSEQGLTALHFASVNVKTSEIIELLLNRGISIDARDEMGFTALHYSVIFGNERNMQLLVEKGANVETKSEDSITPLHLAAACGNTTEKLRYLLDQGAFIDVKQSDGRTPLLISAAQGNLRKMKLLIEKGADIQAQDENGLSALHFAATNKKTTEMIQYLLEKGMQLEVKDKFGRTPLLHSAAHGHLKSVELLCDRGADLKSLDKHEMTALHHAAASIDGAPIIEYLLRKGLPADVRDDMGLSPLQISMVCGIPENEKRLMDNHAGSNKLDLVGPDVSVAMVLETMDK